MTRKTGELWSFTITAKDSFGNIRHDASDAFVATVTGTIDIIPMNYDAISNNDGTFTLEFTCNDVDVFTLRVLLNDVEILNSPITLTIEVS